MPIVSHKPYNCQPHNRQSHGNIHRTADKCDGNSQHYRMRVICPHCQTIYQLETTETNAVLICHRCGTEFGMGEIPHSAQQVDVDTASDLQPTDIFSEPNTDKDEPNAHTSDEDDPDHPAAEDTQGDDESSVEPADTPAENNDAEIRPDLNASADNPAAPTRTNNVNDADPKIIPAHDTWREEASPDTSQTEPVEGDADDDTETSLPSQPPPRAKLRIMPWLIGVVLLIVGSGFWLNHDAWLDDPWLRSVILNTGLGLEIRDKDWRVDPDSVEATWLERRNKETVLVITGEVHNLLQTDLPPPRIHFTLYARDNPDELILERDLVVTRPPMMQAIRQASYLPPPHDETPVAALGKRSFILVLEDMPQNAGNFTLQAKAR